MPRNSDSSKKSAGGTSAPFVPDFLHHESGEIRFVFFDWIASCESAIRPRNDESVDLAFKTTEGFSVWLSWFFLLRNPMGEIFEAETRLMVCERPKFAKSA